MAVFIVTDSDVSANGAAFADQFNVSGDRDTISAGEGGDDILCTGQDGLIQGQGGDDTLEGSAAGQSLIIDGGAGFDVIVGHASDTLIGGDGFDRLEFNAGDLTDGVAVDFRPMSQEVVFDFALGEIVGFELGDFGGTQGDDVLHGPAHMQLSIYGDAGDDHITGAGVSEALAGGLGDDTLKGGGGSDTLFALDNLALDARLGLTPATDTGLDHDVLKGGAGADHLFAGLGSALLDGGLDNDTADFSLIDQAVAINMPSHRAVLEGGSRDVLNSIEAVVGSDFGDRLIGDSGVNSLAGGAGDDTLRGGLGFDQLSGGAGADVFIYTMAADGGDTLSDLDVNDTVDLHAMDANTHKGGNQAFRVVDSFTGHAGDLVLSYDFHVDFGEIQADRDGDGAADFTIFTNGDPSILNLVL